ncbi:MAG TPA: tetratricopeptide repeat protein [Planctomycetaceae bacterium]|nr:tetratricopeptide repeat protein [Planctomycetaceae bacterium]
MSIRDLMTCCVAIVALAGIAFADPPIAAEKLTTMQTAWKKTIDESSAAIEKSPEEINLFSRRGDAYFFAGQFDKAVDDYSTMVRLSPEVDGSHWRRGIAYFYAGKYDEAAAQFERYHSFDNVDRENGIWRYLSQVKAVGREKARAGLLKYAKDDREPFPAVYELFAGRITPDAILKGIAEAKISDKEREPRLFYAQLYIGLNEFIEGREKTAQEHLDKAVRNTWAPTAGYGPHYMWQVARLHEELLRTKAAKSE